MTGEIVWEHAVQDVPEAGISADRAADADERERVAAALGLLACLSLRAHYTITPLSLGRYKLAGEISAEVEQACVVTLEPVTSEIEEAYEVVFWPEEEMPAPAAGQVDLDGEPEQEAIVAGQIAVGRIVFETLAAAIDPFPRRPGVIFEGQLSSPEGGKSASPFAVLANLKNKN